MRLSLIVVFFCIGGCATNKPNEQLVQSTQTTTFSTQDTYVSCLYKEANKYFPYSDSATEIVDATQSDCEASFKFFQTAFIDYILASTSGTNIEEMTTLATNNSLMLKKNHLQKFKQNVTKRLFRKRKSLMQSKG